MTNKKYTYVLFLRCKLLLLAPSMPLTNPPVVYLLTVPPMDARMTCFYELSEVRQAVIFLPTRCLSKFPGFQIFKVIDEY